MITSTNIQFITTPTIAVSSKKEPIIDEYCFINYTQKQLKAHYNKISKKLASKNCK